MFGSEYNWLITRTRPLKGVPRVRLAGNGLLTLAIALFCFLAVVLRAEPPHRPLLREATAWAITDMDGIIEGLALGPAGPAPRTVTVLSTPMD